MKSTACAKVDVVRENHGIEEDPGGNRHGHLWLHKMLILRIKVSGRVVVKVFTRIHVIILESIFVPFCKIWV